MGGLGTLGTLGILGIMRKTHKTPKTPKTPNPSPTAQKKGGTKSFLPLLRLRRRCYLTALTTASNAFGSFMARSASTLRFRAIPFWLSLPINCE